MNFETHSSSDALHGQITVDSPRPRRSTKPRKPSKSSSLVTSGSTHRRLQKELAELLSDPLPNCSASPKGDNLFKWTTTILGPAGSVYEGGTFNLDVTFSQDYPFQPPKVVFRTHIYHCNISPQGEICLDILKDRWSPAMTIGKVLLSISALLTDCNPTDPLVPSVAQQYRADHAEHDRTARAWTQRYAHYSHQANNG